MRGGYATEEEGSKRRTHCYCQLQLARHCPTNLSPNFNINSMAPTIVASLGGNNTHQHHTNPVEGDGNMSSFMLTPYGVVLDGDSGDREGKSGTKKGDTKQPPS